MLLELRVRDFGIIENIHWRLGSGLNVITGETGAGKSLVIDAVEALLAGKAGEEAIRYGAEETRIEAVFSLPRRERLSFLKEILTEKGITPEEETLVISCELRRQRPGVVRVNGHAVPKGLLRQLGHFLVDIHGQSEHLSLLDRNNHLDFLDSYAGTTGLREDFSARAAELSGLEQELKALEQEEKERLRREEFLRFQVDEINRAELKEGEEEALEQERSILSSTQELKALSLELTQALQEEDSSRHSAQALDKLGEAVQSLRKLVGLDSSLRPKLDFLEETMSGLEELARQVRRYRDSLEDDPRRLEEIEVRLELIRNLKRKYGQTIAEILDYRTRAEKELADLTTTSERRAGLQETRKFLRKEMGHLASELSQARAQAAQRLVAGVKKELGDLNLAQVEFEVSLTQEKSPEGIPLPGSDTYAFSNEGVDVVEFLVSTNPGEPVKPLAKIASTGEISRFALALKGTLAEADPTPVLIFDEIDIGVGGRSGEVIGKKLWLLARNHQVICVTHLPQIGAFADAHFSVRKEASGSRTTSTIEPVQGNARLKELAAMLAGAQYTETALKGARELIEKAEQWKALNRKHIGNTSSPLMREGR